MGREEPSGADARETGRQGEKSALSWSIARESRSIVFDSRWEMSFVILRVARFDATRVVMCIAPRRCQLAVVCHRTAIGLDTCSYTCQKLDYVDRRTANRESRVTTQYQQSSRSISMLQCSS